MQVQFKNWFRLNDLQKEYVSMIKNDGNNNQF